MSLLPHPTPEQQVVVDRIAAQRLRWCARCLAKKLPAVPSDTISTTATASKIASDGLSQVLALVRSHPAAVAAAVGVTVVLGPRRLLRWSGVLVPILLRYWRSRR